MSFTFEKFNSWGASQNYWRKVIGISDPKVRCFPYIGLGHALVDILHGLKLFWPTRKSLVFIPWGCPYLTESAQNFITEGFQVQNLPSASHRNVKNLEAILSKDLMAVLLVRDHGVTGELQINDEELKLLNDNRIPHIEIQHNWSWTKNCQLPHPYGAQIRIIDAQKVFVILGQRFRMSPLSAQMMDWSDLNWEDAIKDVKYQSQENERVIKDLENQLLQSPERFKVFDFKNSSRLYNRLVMKVRGIDGGYYLEKLLAHLNLEPLKTPGFESRCETTNLSRWDGIYPCWPWWGEERLNEAEQRSTVVLSLSLINNQITGELLNKIHQDCLSEIHFQGN